MNKDIEKFFLAANSCEGFVSEFDSAFRDGSGKAFIVKGGPGTGKSSFLRYIATECIKKDIKVILCPCSSDPDSLDAVILPEYNISLLDGTAPHVVEPKYPGACEELVDTGVFWDSAALFKEKEEIINLTKKNKAFHQNAASYLVAAGEVLNDTLKISSLALKVNKCERFCENICKEFLRGKLGFGKETVRFLSGVTPKGVITYRKSLDNFFDKAIIIDDKYHTAASFILEYVKRYALINGYDVITLKNAFLPSKIIDHIIIPEIDFCICTEHKFCHFERNVRRIHARRFYENSVFSKNKTRITLNRRIFSELAESACQSLLKAKSVHDNLEKIYINTMDFSSHNAFCKTFFTEKLLPLIRN